MRKAWNELWSRQFSWGAVIGYVVAMEVWDALKEDATDTGLKLFVGLVLWALAMSGLWALHMIWNAIETLYRQWKAGRDFLKDQIR